MKKERCSTCKKKRVLKHSIQANSSEGPFEMKICDECADLFDKICDGMGRGQTIEEEEQDESESI